MAVETDAPADRSMLAKRGGVAFVLALLVNVVLVWLFLELDVVASTEYVEYGGVIVFTALGVIGAIVVYYLLTRWAATPNRTFTVIALAVLVLSFIPDVALIVFDDAVTASEGIGLMVLHVPPAFICIAALTGWLFDR